MSLAQWAEPKPCFLSRPRFVKIVPRDEHGRPVGEAYTKRIGRATCASGDPAVSSFSVNGVTYHLCSSCSKADLLDVLPPSPVTSVPAAPAVARDGDLVLVRIGRGIDALTAKLAQAGYRMRPRTRTVRRAGFMDSRVQVWERSS